MNKLCHLQQVPSSLGLNILIGKMRRWDTMNYKDPSGSEIDGRLLLILLRLAL